MSLPEFAQDYFVDTATMKRYVTTGANALGENTYHPLGGWPTIKGLLLHKTSRVWRELGLSDDVEAVFLCEAMTIPEGRFIISAGGVEYRNVTWETVHGLDGASMVRIQLRRSAQ
jgi:hypothetical protein